MVRNRKGQFAHIANEWETQIIDGVDVFYCYKGGELLFFTDDPRVKEYTWAKIADGYSATYKDGRGTLAHRFISEPNENEVVDHINRNKKDNRKENLRNVGRSVNAFNSKVRCDSKSGITGVDYRSDTKRWRARLKKDYKMYNLGCYKTKEEAIKARKRAERELYDDQFKAEGSEI